MNRLSSIILLSIIALALAGCGYGADSLAHTGSCDGYDDYASSPYILPYAAGESFTVGQGNCGPASHYGPGRFAYDLDLPIGTQLIASRSGTVVEIEEQYEDGSPCPNNNYIFIKHSDGTIAAYVHLTKNGAQVTVGAVVSQGDPIGLSGNTGCSSAPHLHFVVFKDDEKIDTVPVTFSNTSANPRGLQQGKTYTAQ